MKLQNLHNKIVLEAPVPQPQAPVPPPAAPGPALAGPAVANAMQEQDPRINPVGKERLPKPTRVRDTALKLKYDIEKARNDAEALVQSAKNDVQTGQVALAQKKYENAHQLLLNIIDRHVLSGLRTKSYYVEQQRVKDVESKFGTGSYFVVTADVDNMKWLNDKSGLDHDGTDAVLAYIGDLFTQYIETVPGTKAYHPHGDEFSSFTYLLDKNQKPLPPETRQQILVQLVNGMIQISNTLTSTGWKAAPDMEPVQATMSFAISSRDDKANKILKLAKSKDVKYFIMVDENLANAYGLEARKDLFQQPLHSVMVDTSARISQLGPQTQTQPQPGAEQPQAAPPALPEGRLRSRKALMSEAKDSELEFVKTIRGPVFLKCNPDALSPEDEEKIGQMYAKKQAYLKVPVDYSPRGMPLAEKYRGRDRQQG